MMSYDVRMMTGYMIGQGAYMRTFDARPWGDVFRHVGVGLVIGIPIYLSIIWLYNRWLHNRVVAR